MSVRKTILLSLVASFLLPFAGCSGCSETEAKARLPEAKKASVEKGATQSAQPAGTGTPAPEEALLAQVFTGTTEAHRRSVIAPSFGAIVKKVFVREGDFVKKGDPLVKLDTSDMALAKKQASAAIEAAQANHDLSTLDWDRMKPLFESGSIPKSQWDMIDAKLKAAKAGLAQAKVAMDSANKQLGDSTIRAPYAGLIVKKMVSEGERVTTMPPSALVVLEEIDILDLRIKVSETQMSRFTVGQELSIHFSAVDKDVTAVVSTIVASVDPMTRTFPVIVQIDNADHVLRPGMFAEVRLAQADEGNASEAAP
jgi:RND family efflux transporter MFP subunit